MPAPQGPIRVKVKKPAAVKPPAGDVASSGADYGRKKAAPAVKRELHTIKVRQTQAKDVKSRKDLARAPAYVKAHPPAVKHKGGALAFLDNALSGKLTAGAVTAAEKAAAATVHEGYKVAKGSHYLIPGSALAKVVPEKLLKNAANDVVDLPANAIPSVYVPTKLAVTGDPGKAAKMLVKPFKDVAEHPLKSFVDHPIGTALIFRGGKGLVGHTAGRVLRTIPSDTTRRIASTARAPKVIPNAKETIPRRYSSDVISKGGQVAAEKVKVRYAHKKGKAAPQAVASTRDLHRMVDERAHVAKVVSAQNEAVAGKAARKAISRKSSAAVTLAAQSITNGTRADLVRYLQEIRAQHPTLEHADDRATNERLQAQITDALSKHDDAKVQAAARAFQEHAKPTEAQVVAHNLVKPDEAVQARLAPAAMRQGASVAGRTTAVAAGRQARKTSNTVRVRAIKDVAKADQGVQKALADARVSNVRAKSSSTLKTAEREQRQAVRDLARLNKQRRGTRETTVTNAVVLRAARQRVRTANAKVITERARIRGVAPKEADALRAALAGKDQAVGVRNQAVVVHRQTRAQHIAAKNAPFSDETTMAPVTVAQVQAKLGNTQPAFVTHSPIRRRSPALPSDPASIPVKVQRSAEAVRKGLIDANPDQLVEQSMSTSRLIDAAKHREKLINDVGYRPHPSGDVQTWRTEDSARGHAPTAKDQSGGMEWSAMRRQDGRWSLVPKATVDRVKAQEKQIDVHPVLKGLGAQWRRNVLAFSPKWLTQNFSEGGMRAFVAGAGPTSYLRAHRAMKFMSPEDLQQLKAYTMGGGQHRVTERLSRERIDPATLTGLTKNAYDLRNAPVAKQGADAAVGLYRGWTDLTMRAINGTVETQIQKAMVGAALRNHPLMDPHIVGLSEKAARELAQGLSNTETMAQMGRAVDDMFGKYGKFPPGLRQTIATYTPFIAWTLNAVNFIYHVLPRDHPVLTSLLASANQATEEWRKQHGLFMDFWGKTSKQNPPWLQGSIPTKGGHNRWLSGGTPFGVLANDTGTPWGTLGTLLMPQWTEMEANLGHGNDWQGKPLSKNPSGARSTAAGIVTFLEGQIPASSDIVRVTGVHLPNVRDSAKTPGGIRQISPFRSTPNSSKTKVKANGDGFGKATQTKGDGFGPSTNAKKKGDGFG